MYHVVREDPRTIPTKNISIRVLEEDWLVSGAIAALEERTNRNRVCDKALRQYIVERLPFAWRAANDHLASGNAYRVARAERFFEVMRRVGVVDPLGQEQEPASAPAVVPVVVAPVVEAPPPVVPVLLPPAPKPLVLPASAPAPVPPAPAPVPPPPVLVSAAELERERKIAAIKAEIERLRRGEGL